MDSELLAYLDQRFDAVDQRFDAVDRRLDGIDRRLDAVDQRFDTMDQRFDTVEQRQDATDRRLEDSRRHLGILIENLDGKIQIVAEGVINVDRKIDRVQAELKGEIAEVKTFLQVSYAGLDRRVRRLEGESG